VAAPQLPKNPLIRYGLYVMIACALLWLGAVVLSQLMKVLLAIGIAGGVMLLIGIVFEWQKSKKNSPEASAPVPGAVAPRSSSYLDDISEKERKAAEEQL